MWGRWTLTVKADDTLDDAAVSAKVQEVMDAVDAKIMLGGMLKASHIAQLLKPSLDCRHCALVC
jgi:hypothetical protein